MEIDDIIQQKKTRCGKKQENDEYYTAKNEELSRKVVMLLSLLYNNQNKRVRIPLCPPCLVDKIDDIDRKARIIGLFCCPNLQKLLSKLRDDIEVL